MKTQTFVWHLPWFPDDCKLKYFKTRQIDCDLDKKIEHVYIAGDVAIAGNFVFALWDVIAGALLANGLPRAKSQIYTPHRIGRSEI